MWHTCTPFVLGLAPSMATRSNPLNLHIKALARCVLQLLLEAQTTFKRSTLLLPHCDHVNANAGCTKLMAVRIAMNNFAKIFHAPNMVKRQLEIPAMCKKVNVKKFTATCLTLLRRLPTIE